MITGLNATRLKNHLLNPGSCKFLYSPFAQRVAKQVPELIIMTAQKFAACMTGQSMETSVNSPAGLQHPDAAEPVAEGVAVVHIDAEQMQMDGGGEQQGGEQREGDEEWEA